MAKVRRSQLEIKQELLTVVQSGISKPTRIMYSCNLSWKPLQVLLAELLDGGFITKTALDDSVDKRTHTTYGISLKGSQWLVTYKKLVGEI